MKYIKFLDKVTQSDASIVGGKASTLSQLAQHGFNVPAAFVVTTAAFDEFSSGKFSEEFLDELESAFEKLSAQKLAVRSSSASEDSAQHSWAGQLDTFLNVQQDQLLETIKKCWSSLSSKRSQSYGAQHTVENKTMAVIVQTMIDSDVSGVMFTVHPLTKNPQELLIEAVYGLGELLVQGEVTPSSYTIDKATGSILNFTPGEQQNSQDILSADDVKKLVALAHTIEKFYKSSQDIEWAKKGEQFFVLQSRAITTLS